MSASPTTERIASPPDTKLTPKAPSTARPVGSSRFIAGEYPTLAAVAVEARQGVPPVT